MLELNISANATLSVSPLADDTFTDHAKYGTLPYIERVTGPHNQRGEELAIASNTVLTSCGTSCALNERAIADAVRETPNCSCDQ